jgi:hypothetical protein
MRLVKACFGAIAVANGRQHMHEGSMLRLVSGAAFLLSAYSTTVATADEVQINEHTLCRATIHAFDAHDLPMIQEIRRFVHNVFDDVDAQFRRTRESTRSA